MSNAIKLKMLRLGKFLSSAILLETRREEGRYIADSVVLCKIKATTIYKWREQWEGAVTEKRRKKCTHTLNSKKRFKYFLRLKKKCPNLT